MNKLLYKLYRFISVNKIWSLFGLIFLFGILLFLAQKIEFEEDITKLIPSNSKTEELQKILKSVNFTDKIIVNIQRQPQGTVEDLTHYAAQILDNIEKNTAGFVNKIQGTVEESEIDSTLDFLYENAPFFLNEADYNALAEKLQKDSIAELVLANYKTLLSPSGIVAKKTILRDPLGISFIALKKLQQLGIGDQFTLKDGFLISKDEQNALLFISPTFPSSETSRNAVFADSLYSIQNRLNDAFAPKIKSEYFGAVLIAVANAQQIKNDIQFTVGIALFFLILIFILFYKKLTVPLILFVPTIFGGLLSIAMLYLIRSQISAISLGIGSVLLGVTLDYSLHILTHIRNNETIESLYKDITIPILMSSLTTAMAFLCLLFLDSQALQDLGIFAAISVMGASVFALLFIPQVYKGGSLQNKKFTLLDRVALQDFHKNKWLIGLVAFLLVLSVFTYNQVVFNKDISKLNFEPAPAMKAKENLDKLTNIESKSIYLAAFGKSTNEALRSNDIIFSKLQELEKQGVIISFSSIGGILHSKGIQQQKIESWRQFWNPSVIQNLKINLIESSENLGFKPTTFNQFYSYLESDFEPLEVDDYVALNMISIDDFITEEINLTTITSLVKVKEDKIDEVKSIFKSLDQTLLIDRQEMNETLLGNLKNDFNSLIGYSLLAVLLILIVFFRSFSLTLVTAIPIFLTWVITIGVMGLLGIEFNIFNIIISTFIFGLGIDYSIFITNGMLKENQTGEKTLGTHRTSIILSVITTILGVGVLIFAKHPALYSISLVSIIGIFSAMLVSFTIQPSLFLLFIGSSKKRTISLRLLIHSVLSFIYYGLGGICLSLFSMTIMRIIPLSKKAKMKGFHIVISKFMKSVLYTNPFFTKKIINESNEDFQKPGFIIANHTSFLDILAIGMLHPKIIFLVNDWVYNSPIFGKAVQFAGFYPVSGGLEKGVEHLKIKVAQGYSLIAFPEGSRSTTNKIRRFHKGAFFLAEKLHLDIIPVLIHGNAEILAKGSFAIRNGSLTIKILKRISFEDKSLGGIYKERTKKISAYFRREFQVLRDEIEGPTYFHKLILNDYRYKGDALYLRVKKDLYENKEEYKSILNVIGKNAGIINVSNSYGQLDFLLLLNSADRKITTFIEDETNRSILKHSFISNHYDRITFANSLNDAFSNPTDVVIMDVSTQIDMEANQSIKTNLIGSTIIHKSDKLVIFKLKGKD